MRLGRRLGAGIAVLAVCLVVAGAGTSRAGAQAALPYMAYGSGLTAGQVVEAYVEGNSVGRVTADEAGRWKIQVEPGSALNGQRIVFHVDGTATDRSAIFESGRFPLPPGIQLGAPSSTAAHTSTPVAGATPRATPKATPKATPTPRPKPAATPKPASCTKNGRPIPCVPPRPTPPALPARR